MRRHIATFTLMLLIATVILGFGLAQVVLADGGPHGGYTPTTDACAGCHRAHTAAAPRLLTTPVENLCLSCHGSLAAGADTNVEDGVYLERDTVTETPAEGIADRGLKGGGFVNTVMATDWPNPNTAPLPTTSSHTADGALGTAWGWSDTGVISPTLNAGLVNFSLSCTNCHDPHGTGTYRILRELPLDSGATVPVSVADETNKVYTVSDTPAKSGNQYFGEFYGPQRDELSDWCAQCHTRYLAITGSGSTNSGDAIFAYRHLTQGGANCNLCHVIHGGPLSPPNPFGIESRIIHRPACVTCHVAHGSSASMISDGPYSGSVAWPDGATTPNGSNRSSLLRVDNRGTCELCHGK